MNINKLSTLALGAVLVTSLLSVKGLAASTPVSFNKTAESGPSTEKEDLKVDSAEDDEQHTPPVAEWSGYFEVGPRILARQTYDERTDLSGNMSGFFGRTGFFYRDLFSFGLNASAEFLAKNRVGGASADHNYRLIQAGGDFIVYYSKRLIRFGGGFGFGGGDGVLSARTSGSNFETELHTPFLMLEGIAEASARIQRIDLGGRLSYAFYANLADQTRFSVKELEGYRMQAFARYTFPL